MAKEKEDSFSKGFKFAAGFIVFVFIFLYFFGPRLVIGPVPKGGKIVPNDRIDNYAQSDTQTKEVSSPDKYTCPDGKKVIMPYECISYRHQFE